MFIMVINQNNLHLFIYFNLLYFKLKKLFIFTQIPKKFSLKHDVTIIFPLKGFYRQNL